MKKSAPPWLVALRTQWRAVALAILSLLLIWGAAAFAWGSLNAWAKRKAVLELEGAVGMAMRPVRDWLQYPMEPLDALLNDSLLNTLPQLPLGLGSPAAQRWLDTQLQNPNVRDLMLMDFATGRSVMAMGATPLPTEVVGRLNGLNTKGTVPMIVAAGSRNAMLYFAVPLEGASATLVVLPRSLRQLGALAPAVEGHISATVVLVVPHANGMEALWHPDDPLRLELVGPVAEDSGLQPLQVDKKIPGFAQVRLQAQWQGDWPRAPFAGFMAIGFWAVLLSCVVLWRWLRPVYRKVAQKVAPVLGPVLMPVQKVVGGPVKKVAGVRARVSSALSKAVRRLGAVLQGVWPKRGAHPPKDPDNWRKAGVDEKAEALTDGPGGFIPRDFGKTGRESMQGPNSAGQRASGRVVLQPFRSDTGHFKLKRAPVDDDAEARRALFEEDEEQTLQARVLRCVHEGLVELLYQPMYTVADGTVYANEVLARLADGEGTITPGQFMPILSAMGRLAELDAVVFEKVMAMHFNDRMASTPLSLNISGNSLDDLSYLREVVQQGPRVLKHLIFEVRSNEVVRDPNALQLIKALQRQGARIAIDYFGGGMGMVQATKAIGLDIIKADAGRLENREHKKDMLDMCMEAVKLDIPVVMEKIEQKHMEEFARRAGVSVLQGYGLGKPAPTIQTLPLAARL